MRSLFLHYKIKLIVCSNIEKGSITQQSKDHFIFFSTIHAAYFLSVMFVFFLIMFHLDSGSSHPHFFFILVDHVISACARILYTKLFFFKLYTNTCSQQNEFCQCIFFETLKESGYYVIQCPICNPCLRLKKQTWVP